MLHNPEISVSGRIIETELLGKLDKQYEVLERRRHPDGGYIAYGEAVNLVKRSQPPDIEGRPYDPTDPNPTPFVSDLHASVAEELSPEDYSRLKFYTAVGSALDHWHGVDGFFEFDSEDGHRVRVTLDVTANTAKDSYKADVILQVPEDGLDRTADKKQYKQFLSEFCYAITEAVGDKIESKKRERAA